MKKLLIYIVAVGMLATSAMALEGNVTEIQVKSNGDMHVKVGTYIKQLVGTDDAVKAMYAAALTAKSSGSPVIVGSGTYDSIKGWTLFKIK